MHYIYMEDTHQEGEKTETIEAAERGGFVIVNFPFTQQQKAFLIQTFGVDFNAEMNDDDLLELEDRIADYLQLHGINEAGDGENEIGTLCADILTIIAEND